MPDQEETVQPVVPEQAETSHSDAERAPEEHRGKILDMTARLEPARQQALDKIAGTGLEEQVDEVADKVKEKISEGKFREAEALANEKVVETKADISTDEDQEEVVAPVVPEELKPAA